MIRKVGNRRGFTLTEVIVTMVLVTTVVAVGAVMLSNDESDRVKNAASDALAFLRTARNVAIRQSHAVSVLVWHTGTNPGGGGVIAGKLEAYESSSDECEGSGGTLYDEISLEVHGGQPYDGAGITRIVPEGSDSIDICFRPNGRVVDGTDGQPFDGAEDVDFSGNAEIWFQFGPLSDPGGTLSVPRAQIIVPYTGLMRMVL